MSTVHRGKPKSARGFCEYGSLRTRDGASIVVYQSSAASERCAWMNVLPRDTKEPVIVHLNAEQARELAKALQAFVEEES